MTQMTVEQALNLISNALQLFKGTWFEHMELQKAFQIIVTEIEKNKQKDDEQTS
jgi:hypothetical protein